MFGYLSDLDTSASTVMGSVGVEVGADGSTNAPSAAAVVRLMTPLDSGGSGGGAGLGAVVAAHTDESKYASSPLAKVCIVF